MASNPNVKAVGNAPPDSRCDCEHMKCERALTRDGHRAGSCRAVAVFLVEAYGMMTKLCPRCLNAALYAKGEAS